MIPAVHPQFALMGQMAQGRVRLHCGCCGSDTVMGAARFGQGNDVQTVCGCPLRRCRRCNRCPKHCTCGGRAA